MDGLAVRPSLATPIPPTSSDPRMEFVELLENLIVPPVHPIFVGVKLTLRFTLFSLGRASGSARPDVVKSALRTSIPEIVTLVGPVFVTVTR